MSATNIPGMVTDWNGTYADTLYTRTLLPYGTEVEILPGGEQMIQDHLVVVLADGTRALVWALDVEGLR